MYVCVYIYVYGFFDNLFNLMMAKSKMAETCIWYGYLIYTYKYSCVM